MPALASDTIAAAVASATANVDAGTYRPVIDRRYALDEVVEATRYVETGQKTGNVVLRVSDRPATTTRVDGLRTGG